MAVYCNRLFFGRRDKSDLSWAKWLFPVISSSSSLRELDRYSENAIRYVYWGSFREKRYRTTYKELKEMGFKSLVHDYYHNDFEEEAVSSPTF